MGWRWSSRRRLAERPARRWRREKEIESGGGASWASIGGSWGGRGASGRRGVIVAESGRGGVLGIGALDQFQANAPDAALQALVYQQTPAWRAG